MKTFAALAYLAGALALGPVYSPRPPQEPFPPDAPKNMKPYTLCVLVRGPKWSASDGKFAAERMGPHLASIRRLLEARRLIAAGPFTSQGHGIGVGIFATTSIDQAREWMSSDPEVKAGRLAGEFQTVLLPDLSAVKAEFAPKRD